MREQAPDHLKVLIAGGGTGGHLFPAVAIARGLREAVPACEVRFVGSYYGLETKILPERNEVFYPLDIQGIQRQGTIEGLSHNLKFPWKFIRAYRRCRSILKLFRPDLVIGTGGYASGLPLLAAQRQKIPTLIQEQNSYPGLTTRKLAKKAGLVCVTYKESLKYLKTENYAITGNPLRFNSATPTSSEARKTLKLPAEKKVVFILGGSQGSHALNSHFKGRWRHYVKEVGIHLLWQAGPREYDGIVKAVGRSRGVTVIPFVHDMLSAYMAADLVICRAGAMTISELTALGRPSILVPLPGAAADHQTKNAQLLRRRKAARLVPEKSIKDGALEEALTELVKDDNKLQEMSLRAHKLAKPRATTLIVKHALRLAGK